MSSSGSAENFNFQIRKRMNYGLYGVMLTTLALGACANQSGAQMGLFTTTAPVVAVVGGELYTGQSVCYIDGSGVIQLKSSSNPEQECSGDFRYESERLGVGDMRCTGGSSATFQFRALSTLTGYGFGRARTGDVSFAYGMTPEQAEPYLRLPSGKKLRRKDGTLVLTDG
jgi:hypothetical protein